MKWLTKVAIKNYRAFDSIQFEVEYGRPLLIYGENGSGKSSLYKALRDVFGPQDFRSSGFQKNNFVDPSTPGIVVATIRSSVDSDDAFEEIHYSSDSDFSEEDKALIQRYQLNSGFLDYKNLLQIHGIEKSPSHTPNLFQFLVGSLLASHPLQSFDSSGSTTVEHEFKYLDSRREKRISKSNESRFEFWLNGLQASLTGVVRKANEWISTYFNPNLKIGFKFPNSSEVSLTRLPELEVLLEPMYGNKIIQNYHDFINEARLSAISICLFLSSLTFRSDQENVLRLLFLDDVFIGLDTNNRRPLLRLLANEFLEKGNGVNFQLILSTYDRSWFEYSRLFFDASGSKACLLELFANSQDDPSLPDKIISRSNSGLSYLDDAQFHFEKNEYAVAAHLVRKFVEQEIKRILPEGYMKDLEGVKITKLSTMILQFKKFQADCQLTIPNIDTFELDVFLQSVMNPFSHDDAEKPVYKSEISTLIRLASNFSLSPKYTIKACLSPILVFDFSWQESLFSLTIHPSDFFYQVFENTQPRRVMPVPTFKIIVWELGGVKWGQRKNGSLTPMDDVSRLKYVNKEKKLDELIKAIELNDISVSRDDFLQNCICRDNRSLSEFLNWGLLFDRNNHDETIENQPGSNDLMEPVSGETSVSD